MSTKPVTLNNSLLGLAKEFDKHFWLGEAPPFDFVSANVLGCTNFRLSPANHQRYDVVWYFEQSPADLAPGQFQLVFDELLRLFGEKGKLVVRYRQNEHFTVINFKHFLGRRYNTNVTVESETVENGVHTTVFNVQRLSLARYQSKTWTFAILTQGKRRANVLRFLRSIREFDPENVHEILIVGPRDEAYDEFVVRYHEATYREHLAEISRKKNDIAWEASEPNLLIVHDRYVLDNNFFDGFEKFGYDFDFLTILQWYECGTRFPAYAALTRGDLTWSAPIDCCDYNAIKNSQYLNGGLLIAKTESLRDIRFNDMLFWNQAEDLELACAFREQSIPPRVNCFSSATTLGITPEYTKAFVPEFAAIKRQRIFGIRPIVNASMSLLSPGRRLERYFRPHLKKLFKAG